MTTDVLSPEYKVTTLPPVLVPNARYYVAEGTSYFRLYVVNSSGGGYREILGTPGEQGPEGPAGPQGETGIQGPQGEPGVGDNNASLTSLAALGTVADRVAYTTGVDTWAETPLTSFARTLLDDATASAARSTLGLGTMATETAANYLTTAVAAAGYQPLDSDLTAIAALSTTAFGRALLELADAAAGRTALGLGTMAVETAANYLTTSAAAAGYQPLDSDLTAVAALTTTAFGRGLLELANAAAGRSAFGLGTMATETATNYLTTTAASSGYQPLDSDLTAIAALTTTVFGRSLLELADAAAGRTALGLGTMAVETAANYLTTAAAAAGYQPLDSDLTSISALTTTTFGRSLLTQADASAARTTLGLAIGTNVQAYDAELAAIAGLTSAADKGIYFTGSGTASTFDLTSFARTLLDDSSASAVRATIGVRERLSANRTYYVRTDGSDSNDGLANSSGGAFLTLQHAVNVVLGLDLSVYDVTIQVADGTYTAGITITAAFTGSGNVNIIGNSTTPANCVISVTSAHCFNVSGGGKLFVGGFKLQTTTAGSCILVSGSGSSVRLSSSMDFGACAGAHISVDAQAAFVGSGIDYTISGGAVWHWFSSANGPALLTSQSQTITLTGTPNFSGQFFRADGGYSVVNAITFSGSATGQRYYVQYNGIIQTYLSGGTYLPGDVGGGNATGGQYL